MKRILFPLALIISLFLAACGGNATPAPTETPAVTATADLCSAENLPNEALKVNKLMREFDDYSSLASNTPQGQLVVIIPELQRLLRDAEDLTVPPCLQTLSNLQKAHMGTVVQTLIAFMNNTDVNVVNAGIAQSRDLHTQYEVELARLLGVTLAPTPTLIPTTPTVTP